MYNSLQAVMLIHVPTKSTEHVPAMFRVSRTKENATLI